MEKLGINDDDLWLALAFGHKKRQQARSVLKQWIDNPDPSVLSRQVRGLRPDWSRVAQIKERAVAAHIKIIPVTHDDYPLTLRSIPDPPPVLFLKGEPDCLSEPQIAIVGARRATPQGERIAHQFALELAGAGLGITSGLAFGIDASAHLGALQAGGQTVAVLGCGLDVIYPAEHCELAEQICVIGALVSEYPPGTAPRRHHFPARNRIISGLSLGTIVVEAGERSGSLITARTALEQGRDVFAVPGPLGSALSRGVHQLIKDGAPLVDCSGDVLAHLAPQLRWLMAQTEQESSRTLKSPRAFGSEPVLVANDAEHRLVEQMGWEPNTLDELVELSGLTVDTVSSMLLSLELKGQVCSLLGGSFIRAK